MSQEDRNTESMLLRERWNLIQQGTDQRSIKFRNKQIYVANQLFDKVQNSKLIYSLLIGYPALTLLIPVSMHLYQLIQWTLLIPAILTINPPNLEKAGDSRAKLLKVTVINFCSVIGKKADLLEPTIHI